MASVGIALYTVLVAVDSAEVRASIVGGLFIAATRFVGRLTFAPAILFAAGTTLALANPNVLWDIGFRLGFTAVLRLMTFVHFVV